MRKVKGIRVINKRESAPTQHKRSEVLAASYIKKANSS